ncbi:MAG: uncharacterized DUF497 family protein [Arenicella sp.]|jgi:uncharacterized DUF497 family protein
MIDFEWDRVKAASNQKEQKVSFEEARSIFFDEYAQQFYDAENFDQEERFLMLGKSVQSRILIVVHCERDEGEVIRIISARKATAKERKFYEGPPL